ncbi:MAG TPA: CCA tRNA nucleotidyltransferase [Candidatus Binatia bacterium]|jgi:poly(A) polymerase|nr:CCA tRNA nucleotidyltransferase [Candidatus Binatia bacterium]
MTASATGAADIVRRLRVAGHEAYLAGGSVRDRLLGREPIDHDIATSAPPEEVVRLFPRTVPVGAQFGVILVIDRGARYEVATFRSDDAYVDGRRPTQVHFGTARDDALRRDFTINALFADPQTGEIHDYVGGAADLRAGVIRAIGDPRARIAEDRLRMLRAVRFAARFGFAIDPATFDAIVAAAPTVTDMAAERIGDEIVKMLTEGGARRAFELLDATGLLPVVLPEIARMQGVAQSADFHPEGDVWLHTLLLLQQLPAGVSETLALGALLHDVAKPRCVGSKNGRITFYGHPSVGADVAVAMCQRLRRSRMTWERVAWLVRNHLRLVQSTEMRLSTLKKLLAEEGIDELLRLARLDALASNGDLRWVLFCERRRAELEREAPLRPPRLLGGNELLAMGHAAGPRVGEILRALEDAQLEGDVRTRADAERYVRERFPL